MEKVEVSRPSKTTLKNVRLCRFCLASQGTLTNIFDHTEKKNTVPLQLQIMSCVAIEVYQNDGFPELICDNCRRLVVQSYSFKANCKKAETALKNFQATGNLKKPLSKKDFQNYLPKEETKLPKLNKDDFKTVKIPPPQDPLTDLQPDPKEDEHEEAFEIRESSSNEYNVKIVSPATPKNIRTIHVKIFSCAECNETFTTKLDLDNHTKSQHQVKQQEEETPKSFNCSYCEAVFSKREEFLSHTRRKHGKKALFMCEECGKSFVFKQGLERHILTHSENKPHKCSYCEASFSSPIKLARHMTSHAGLRPYPCKLCKHTFMLSHHLTRHMRCHYAARTNNPQQIGQHKCDICSMSFRKKDSLINHSAIHSMVNLKCVICYTEFSNAQEVKNHITSHLAGLPYPCEKCDYSFDTQEQLEEHEVKHAEMEYEEKIEKQVVEEAKVQGLVTGDMSLMNDDDEFGGDHMGKDQDEDYECDDDEEYRGEEGGEIEEFSIVGNNPSMPNVVRRSERKRNQKRYTDFLKEELDSEPEVEEFKNPTNVLETVATEKSGTAMDVEEAEEVGGVVQNQIKPIFRTEGTKVYQRKTPVVKKQKLALPDVSVAKFAKTAPLSQITQPQVTTIENLGLTTQDLQCLPTEKYVDMKIGNKTVRVQKLVLTKQEVKAMAKEGKIRGNTVLIKNPGHISNITKNEPKFSPSPLTKTYKKKTGTPQTSNAAVLGKSSVIINDIIIDNIDNPEDFDLN